MKYVKTVKHFVSGSDKFFDIFECTFTDVEESRDANGRRNIFIKIDDKEYRGMWNKQVFEHLIENEGKPSFVVLWKSTKGNHMIAYSWSLWEDYLKGDSSKDVSEIPENLILDKGEAFVYMWVNLQNGKKYIGKHCGDPDDNYVCSNPDVRNDILVNPENWFRTILAFGPDNKMHELETILLLQLRAANSSLYYNLSNNLRK